MEFLCGLSKIALLFLTDYSVDQQQRNWNGEHASSSHPTPLEMCGSLSKRMFSALRATLLEGS